MRKDNLVPATDHALPHRSIELFLIIETFGVAEVYLHSSMMMAMHRGLTLPEQPVGDRVEYRQEERPEEGRGEALHFEAFHDL